MKNFRRLPSLETSKKELSVRGDIISADNFKITTSKKIYKASIDSRHLDENKKELFIKLFSIYSNIPEEKIAKKINMSLKSPGNLVLSYNIDSKTAKNLKELGFKLRKLNVFKSRKVQGGKILRGLSINESGEKRIYSYEDTLTPVAGYISKYESKNGKTKVKGIKGLEKQANIKLLPLPKYKNNETVNISTSGTEVGKVVGKETIGSEQVIIVEKPNGVKIPVLESQVRKAPTKEVEVSNAEKFSTSSGALIKKDYLEIGDIKGAKVQVVKFQDLISDKSTSAIKFEYEVKSSYSTDTKQALLDVDEIDGLMKSIKIMQEKIFPSTSENYSEVIYRSRGGFEAGCYWSKGEWTTYLKLEKYDGKSYVFLSQEDFTTLYSFLEQAKGKL